MSGNDDRRSDEGGDVETVSVDLTLIDEMFRMTPAERLRQNDRMAALAARLRDGFDSGRVRWPSRGT